MSSVTMNSTQRKSTHKMKKYKQIYDVWLKTGEARYDRMLDILANEDLMIL